MQPHGGPWRACAWNRWHGLGLRHPRSGHDLNRNALRILALDDRQLRIGTFGLNSGNVVVVTKKRITHFIEGVLHILAGLAHGLMEFLPDVLERLLHVLTGLLDKMPRGRAVMDKMLAPVVPRTGRRHQPRPVCANIQYARISTKIRRIRRFIGVQSCTGPVAGRSLTNLSTGSREKELRLRSLSPAATER